MKTKFTILFTVAILMLSWNGYSQYIWSPASGLGNNTTNNYVLVTSTNSLVTPNAWLNVYDGSKSSVYSSTGAPTASLRLDDVNASSNSGQYSSLSFNVTTNSSNTAAGYMTLIQPTSGGKNGNFAFTLRNAAGGFGEIMRIQSDGTVGIGTTSPGAKLDIVNGTQEIQFLTGGNSSGYMGQIGVNDDGVNFSNNSGFRGFNFKNNNGTLVTIASNGYVGIGTTSPTSLFSVGNSSQFQINSSGNILSINNVATSFPSSQGATGTFLQNDGYGTLSWTTIGGSGWSLTGNSGTTPGTDFIGTTDGEDVVFKRNGVMSGLLNLSGQNTSWGVGALANYPNGAGDNTAIGYQALHSNNYGIGNTAVGAQALYSTNPTDPNAYNTAIGGGAMYNNTTGEGNTSVGYGALYNNSNYTGMYNIAIGYGADVAGSGLGNATAIGWNASATASNSIELGSSSVVFCGINGGAYSSTKALVVGTSTSNGNGAYCTIGGAWTNGSSIGYKDDITTLDGTDILNKISKLEVKRWKYKETEEYHIGPFAEQFHEFFNTGIDDKHISTVDPSGIALIGIQELIRTIDNLKIHQKTTDSLLNVLQNCCAQGTINNTIQNNGSQGQGTSGTTLQVVLANNSQPILYQNEPNPFGENTVIRYFIPDNGGNAYIIFYDMYGKELTKTEITSKGFGNVNTNTKNLASGIYSYSLVVNDNVIDTKKMVKTK